MKFIVKLQAEITIKSRPVRKRFTKILESNVKNVLRRVDEQVTTRTNWDNIEVNTKNTSPENRLALIDTLKCIPGIPMFIEVQQTSFSDLHDIFEKTGFNDDYLAFVKVLKWKYPNCYFVKDPILYLENKYFGDSTHVNKNGSYVYTEYFKGQVFIPYSSMFEKGEVR